MKTLKTLLVIAVVLFGSVATSFAQSNATATATATLIVPISISKTSDMNFGTVAASATAGTVSLDYSSTATTTGGASLILGGASRQAAVFQVTGETNSGFSVSYTTSIVLTNATSQTVTVDNIVADSGAATTLVSGSK